MIRPFEARAAGASGTVPTDRQPTATARSTRAVVLITALLSVLVALTVASTACASLGVETFDGFVEKEGGSAATQAGSHPFSASTTIAFNKKADPLYGEVPEGDVKDIHVALPAGLVGNPTATPRCTENKLETFGFGFGSCPDDTQVGQAIVTLVPFGTFTVPLYNLVPPAGAPAGFGFNFDGLAIIHMTAHVRSASDYGVTIDTRGISETLQLMNTTLTFWGIPADPVHDSERGATGFCDASGSTPPCHVTAARKPFLTNPTSCTGPATTTLSVDWWEQPGTFLQSNFVSHDNGTPPNPLGTEGCSEVPFRPSIALSPTTTAPGTPSGYSFALSVPQNENPDGLAEANLKDAVVTLPTGVAISPSAASGLMGCPADGPEGINLHAEETDAEGTGHTPRGHCPQASKLGTVEVETPLLEKPLQGAVYLAEPKCGARGQSACSDASATNGELYGLYLEAAESGVVMKLAGEAHADPATGQLTAIFNNNPQLPFSQLRLNLFGGSRAPLANPRTCGVFATTSNLTPWTSPFAPDATPSSSFEVAGCAAPQFSPSFRAGTTGNQAGGYAPFSVTVGRADQDQDLGRIQLQAPPGLLGKISGIPLCNEAQANAGACSATSQIGHVTVAAGPGENPTYLPVPGQPANPVYLTTGYKGAPFGLSVVVPAVAGPFNLGNVVVRAAVNVDPHTARITVASDPLPTILQGIPLQLRTVDVTIDRAGFMFNPTNCSPLSVDGTITSTQGTTAAVSSHFQAANCATLPFKPKFTVLTQAKTSKANGASLHVKVTSGPGQANIGKVKVDLPKQLPSRLTTLQKACPDAVFSANPASCPAASVVGSATAMTPVLNTPLAGPAYLVSHAGAAFPDLVVVLQGEGITLDLVGNTDIKKGITISSFNTVPDAPISTFDLVLPEGPHSALAAFGNLCKTHLNMPTALTGQNGAQVKQTTRIAVSGCPKPKKHSKAKHGRKRKK